MVDAKATQTVGEHRGIVVAETLQNIARHCHIRDVKSHIYLQNQLETLYACGRYSVEREFSHLFPCGGEIWD